MTQTHFIQELRLSEPCKNYYQDRCVQLRSMVSSTDGSGPSCSGGWPKQMVKRALSHVSTTSYYIPQPYILTGMCFRLQHQRPRRDTIRAPGLRSQFSVSRNPTSSCMQSLQQNPIQRFDQSRAMYKIQRIHMQAILSFKPSINATNNWEKPTGIQRNTRCTSRDSA
jgi:hypothetical protein